MMKAAVVDSDGLNIKEVEAPTPSSSEVLIQVRACGMNRADSMIASGMAHGSVGGAGTIPGMEYAGEVVEVGADVTGINPGDRVMCTGHAGWAELATADWGRTVAIPDSVDWSRASTLQMALQTMHNAIVTVGGLQTGESVMIQGASTGVGLMGMQIAKAMGAKLVVGSSTSPERRARLTDHGADLAVNSKDPNWVDQVLEATDGQGVDLIIDQLSGYVHAARRIQYTGVTFRTRSAQEIRDLLQAMKADLWDAVTAGDLSIPIDSEFPLEEAATAVDYMKANKHFGKIVLTV